MEKFHGEIRMFRYSAKRFIEGAELLYALLPSLPESKRDDARWIAGTAEFMGRSALTTSHVKRWYLAKKAIAEKKEVPARLRELREIAEEEIANVNATFPLVDFDSRLGFEPSMEYIGDRAHLEWKLEVMNRVLTEEIPQLEKEN